MASLMLRWGDTGSRISENKDLKLAKLDRFLVCPSFIDLNPTLLVTTLPKEISDHCPILLSTTWCDFGPPPFKMFNSWLSRDRFEHIFISVWNNFIGFGTPDQYLNAKLKCVTEALKEWRRTDYLKEEMEIKKIKDLVDKLDTKAESRALTNEEIEIRRTGYKDMVEK